MPSLIHRQRPCMASLFELWLHGEDEEHLEAVAEAALDEIQRVERLLSRFDPAAEIHRVNQQASHRPVLVDYELLAILQDCQQRFVQTEGYFNVCALSQAEEKECDNILSLTIDESTRTVQLLHPRAFLDLGGYGKGYALDAAARIARQHGVTTGFFHGGTSSALALDPLEDRPWLVGIRDPFAEDETAITLVGLVQRGLSTSAALAREGVASDVINPVEGRPLQQQAACTVLAATAVDAEVLSTALLAMGKERAIDYLQRKEGSLPPSSVLWIEQQQGKAILYWLQGDPDE